MAFKGITSITPLFQSLCITRAVHLHLCTFSQARDLQPFELFERLERFELNLWLPAAAQGTVQLHHDIELLASRAGE
jgi:hypothetical protein